MQEIKGYGWSVWYVPNDFRQFARDYKFKHIPHVTLQSNLTKEEAEALFEKSAKTATIQLDADVSIFPTMYAHDPLKAVGWYATGIDTPHRPHMSVSYYDELPKWVGIEGGDPPFEMNCFLAVADTQPSNPSEWYLTLPERLQFQYTPGQCQSQ
jgi:hypothetical protein